MLQVACLEDNLLRTIKSEMRRGIFICRCKNQPYFVVRVEKMPIFAVSIETVPRWVYDTEEREAHPNASFNWL